MSPSDCGFKVIYTKSDSKGTALSNVDNRLNKTSLQR